MDYSSVYSPLDNDGLFTHYADTVLGPQHIALISCPTSKKHGAVRVQMTATHDCESALGNKHWWEIGRTDAPQK
eukprot:SAG31_NODE_11980_length_980_cov_1.190692_2_plen_74_part_00